MMVEEGFDIVINDGSPESFYWGSKTNLETPKLKLLIDVVSSSCFISEVKSKCLLISWLICRNNGWRKVGSQNLYGQQDEDDNQQIYIIVDIIGQAIDEGKQLQFGHYDYNEKK